MTAEGSKMEARLAVLEAAIPRIDASMHEIAKGVQAIVRLESQHQEMSNGLARAFKAIETLEAAATKRIEDIEREMPTLKLARNVIISFAGMCMMVVIAFLLYKAGLWVSTGGVKAP